MIYAYELVQNNLQSYHKGPNLCENQRKRSKWRCKEFSASSICIRVCGVCIRLREERSRTRQQNDNRETLWTIKMKDIGVNLLDTNAEKRLRAKTGGQQSIWTK